MMSSTQDMIEGVLLSIAMSISFDILFFIPISVFPLRQNLITEFNLKSLLRKNYRPQVSREKALSNIMLHRLPTDDTFDFAHDPSFVSPFLGHD